MKFIIKEILITFALISMFNYSDCEVQDSRRTLNGIFEQIKSIKEEDEAELVPNKKFMQHIDMDCVKDFLKLQQNGEITVNIVEDLILSSTALTECLGDHVNEYIEEFIDLISNEELKNHLNCAKFKLQKVEPTSKFIENFNQKLNDTERKACEELLSEDAIKEFQEYQEKLVGPIVKLSCGAMTGSNDYIKLVTKSTLIAYGDDNQDVKEAEMKALIEYFKTVSFASSKCIFDRIEKKIAPQNF